MTVRDVEKAVVADPDLSEKASVAYTNTEVLGEETERDEVLEVKKLAAGDTRKVRLWRLVMTAALLATATAVTLVTYKRLLDEETSNFETAVSDVMVSPLSLCIGTR